MSLLPIVERELRVASRRKSTYRMRWMLALAVLVLWFLLLVSSRSSSAEKGQIMFVAIGVLALAFGLLAGIFLTADCLSEEKREGTLGLLFLTDLQGYDVVLGKLIATSLHAAYGLLAIFPILALPLLMGGVTAGEFWRLALVLVTTLFLSLSLGMAVSAVNQETRQAMVGTLLALIVFAGLLPVLWWLRCWVAGNALWSGLLWTSPGFLFSRAFETCFSYPTGAHQFWASFATIFAIGICSLIVASLYLPRAWQVGGENRTAARESWSRRWRFGSAGWRSLNRCWQLELNPFFWLADRDRLPRYTTTGVIVGLLMVWSSFLFGLGSSRASTQHMCFSIALFMAFGIHQVLKILITAEATRRLSEDYRSGALELLLVSPLSVSRIIAGQRAALKSIFKPAIALALLANIALWFCVVFDEHLRMPTEVIIMFTLILFGGGLLLLVDFMALTRVGMWMALRTRRHDRAILGTILRVMLGPWLGILFGIVLTMGSGGMSEDAAEVMTVLWLVGSLGISAIIAARASVALEVQMRWLCAGVGPGRRAMTTFDYGQRAQAPAGAP